MAKRAVLLDRDDTINKDVPYCARPEDFVLLPTVGEAIRLWNNAGLLVLVVTNQSGIGRGYFDHATLARIHEKMRADLAAHGARVDGIYYCPHRPEDRCACRKPATALAERAATEHGVDVKRSFVVGDRIAEVQMARQLGAKVAMVPSLRGKEELALLSDKPDFTAGTLLEAAHWVLQELAHG